MSLAQTEPEPYIKRVGNDIYLKGIIKGHYVKMASPKEYMENRQKDAFRLWVHKCYLTAKGKMTNFRFDFI